MKVGRELWVQIKLSDSWSRRHTTVEQKYNCSKHVQTQKYAFFSLYLEKYRYAWLSLINITWYKTRLNPYSHSQNYAIESWKANYKIIVIALLQTPFSTVSKKLLKCTKHWQVSLFVLTGPSVTESAADLHMCFVVKMLFITFAYDPIYLQNSQKRLDDNWSNLWKTHWLDGIIHLSKCTVIVWICIHRCDCDITISWIGLIIW